MNSQIGVYLKEEEVILEETSCGRSTHEDKEKELYLWQSSLNFLAVKILNCPC